MAPKKQANPDAVRLVLVGDQWEEKEKVSDNVVATVQKGEPIQKHAALIAKKLGVANLDGLSFFTANGKPRKPVDPIDLSQPPPDTKVVWVYVKGQGTPAKPKAAKPPAKDGEAKPKKKKPPEDGSASPEKPKKKPADGGAAPAAAAKADGDDEKAAKPKKKPPDGSASESPTAKGDGEKAEKPKKKKPSDSPKAEAEDSAAAKPKKPKKEKAPTPPPPPPEPEPEPEPEREEPAPAAAPPVAALPRAGRSAAEDVLQSIGSAANDEYRRQLVAFYGKYNKAKIGDVDGILRQWRGDEDKLFAQLHERYVRPEEERRRREDWEREQAERRERERVEEREWRRADLERTAEREAQASSAMQAAQAAAVAAVSAVEHRRAAVQDDEVRVSDGLRMQLETAQRELDALKRRMAEETSDRDAAWRRDSDRRVHEEAATRESRYREDEQRKLDALKREHQLRLRDEELGRREAEVKAREAELADQRLRLAADEASVLEKRAAETLMIRAHADALIRAVPSAASAPPSTARSPPPIAAPPAPAPAGVLKEQEALHAELSELRKHLASLSARPFGSDRPPAADADPPQECRWSDAFAPVGEALRAAGLVKYAAPFAKADFDGPAFAQLTEADVTELGITSIGARKRLLNVAAALRERLQPAASEILRPAPNSVHQLPYPETTQAGPPDTALEALVSCGPPTVAAPLPGETLAADPMLAFYLATVTDFYCKVDPQKVPHAASLVGEHAAAGTLPGLCSSLLSIYSIEPPPHSRKVRAVCRQVAPAREPAAELLCFLSHGREAELIAGLLAGGVAGADDWTELVSETGVPYYCSRSAGETQWHRPAVLPQQVGHARSQEPGLGLLAPSRMSGQVWASPLPPPRLT